MERDWNRTSTDITRARSICRRCKFANLESDHISDLFPKLRATGAKILGLDFVSEDSIKAAADAFGNGPLDILINCSGMVTTNS